jgi:hypothetical protein
MAIVNNPTCHRRGNRKVAVASWSTVDECCPTGEFLATLFETENCRISVAHYPSMNVHEASLRLGLFIW